MVRRISKLALRKPRVFEGLERNLRRALARRPPLREQLYHDLKRIKVLKQEIKKAELVGDLESAKAMGQDIDRLQKGIVRLRKQVK